MAISRLSGRKTKQKTRDVFSWPYLLFIEKFKAAQGPGGHEYMENTSDPKVMAKSIARLIDFLGIKTLLTTPPVDVLFTTDKQGNDVEEDYRQYQTWRREGVMRRNMSPQQYEAISALFCEAGIKRGFYGGILGTDGDTSRVAELLAIYAYAMQEDKLFLSEENAFALVACHEGDLHVYSPNEALLASSEMFLQQFGLKLFPKDAELYSAD